MIRIIFPFFRLHKPGMLIRSMVQHQIHDNPDMPSGRLGDQLVHIGKSAEHGVNILIIGNIITVVILGRAVYRRKPDSVNSQHLKVVQLLNDSLKIADPVSVAVAETSGINLIDHCRLPPFLRTVTHILYPSFPFL